MSKLLYKGAMTFIFLVVFLMVIKNPVIYYPDSQGYLDMSIIRSAGYPLFIAMIGFCFGNFFETALLIIQYSIGALAMIIVIKKLKTLLTLHRLWYIILTVILLMPYFFHNSIANRLLSEALAYPLYIIIVGFYVEALMTSKVKPLWFVLPLIFLLLLTRSQFLFIIPIGVIIVLKISVETKRTRFNLPLILAFFAMILMNSLADKTYHYAVHNSFVSTPWTGIHLITPAFFVADADDAAIFENSNENRYFKNVHDALTDKNLNINHLDTLGSKASSIDIYVHHFSEIANATIFEEGMALSDASLSRNDNIIAVDRLTKKMVFPLIRNNIKSYLKLNFRNFIHGFRDDKILIIFLLIFIVCTYKMIKPKTNSAYKLLFLVTGLALGNMALVSIGMHTISRFTFYNFWVLPFIFIILIDHFIKTVKNP